MEKFVSLIIYFLTFYFVRFSLRLVNALASDYYGRSYLI